MKVHKVLILLVFLHSMDQGPVHSAIGGDEIGANNQTTHEIISTADKEQSEVENPNAYNYYGTYNYYSSESPRWTTMASALAAVAIAFFALVQIWFLCGTMKATQNAASAARANAETAIRQTEIMANRDRAWIMVKPDTEPKEETRRLPFGYEVEWSASNVGGTPAFLTELLVVLDVAPLNIPDNRPDYSGSKPFAKFIIPPNGRHSSKISRVFSPTEQGAYFRGEFAITFYGLTKYTDAIGEHITRFYCYWYMRNGEPIFEPVGPGQTVEYT